MIILVSAIGLMVCIAVLFPQVRQMIMNLAEQIANKKASTYQSWLKALMGYAMGGICFIFFFDYCTLTKSGKTLVRTVKKEITDCLSEIDFRSFVKPLLIMSGVYLLGIMTIIRADFSYFDDLGWAVSGYREWYNWSRYVIVFLSYFVQPEIRMTDISPIPQLLAVIILSVNSILLVYIVGNKKITIVRLLASIPLGLSPYFLECLSYKLMAPYMALSITASIVPFLFITRKKAFLFSSVVSLLVMCMTYQASSGIYLLIAVMLCFQDWNRHSKSNKEILSFLATATFAFCSTMLIFRFFLMKPADYYTSTAMFPVSRIIPGILSNIKNYAMTINHDLGLIWKAGIVLVLLFFITKSMVQSEQKKTISFFVSILIIGISFILSYGVYILLEDPLYSPRALYGFGIFLSVLCISVVSNYKKVAIVAVLALNWCFFVFAFSYGNALADQARYAEFRITLLLNDLSALYPERNREDMTFQLKNSIDFTPANQNIAIQYPVIEKLVPRRLADYYCLEYYYFLEYFNFSYYKMANTVAHVTSEKYIDFDTLNLPVVLDSYYHTIQSDGNHILIVLKH